MDITRVTYTILGVMALLLSPARSEKMCPLNYKLVGEECLKAGINHNRTYEYARSFCSGADGFIWQPRNGTIAFQKYITEETGNNSHVAVWIGAKINGTNGWRWEKKTSSELDTNFPWKEQQPSQDSTNEIKNCMSLQKQIGGNFSYIPISCEVNNSVVCEAIAFTSNSTNVTPIEGRSIDGGVTMWISAFYIAIVVVLLLIIGLITCSILLLRRKRSEPKNEEDIELVNLGGTIPAARESSKRNGKYASSNSINTSTTTSPTIQQPMAHAQRLLGNKKEDRPFSMTGKDLELRHLNTMAWFHGKLSRDEAEKLLKPREDGLFLVRESSNFTGDYTLCVCYQRKVEHYRVISKDGKLTIDEEEFFYHLTDLVEHYENDSDGLCTQLMRPVTKNGSKVLQGGGDGWSQGTEVVARYAFPGTSSVDLPFAKRERLTIVHTTNTPDWIRARNHSGSEGLIPTAYINTDKKEVKLESMMWFHGKISRNEAEQLLTPRSEGLFLVRESSNFTGDYTLCVCYQGMVEHYRIVNNYGKLTIDKEEYFDHLTNLVEHYGNDADGLCTQLVRSVTKQGRRHLQATSLEHLDMEDENMYGNMGYNKHEI